MVYFSKDTPANYFLRLLSIRNASKWEEMNNDFVSCILFGTDMNSGLYTNCSQLFRFVSFPALMF